MERKLQQRLVGSLVLASFVLLIAPVLLDADGRIPEKITNIPLPPIKPDLSHIKPISSNETQNIAALPTEKEVQEKEYVIAAQPMPKGDKSSTRPVVGLWSVQVASFRDVKKASAFKETLRGDDFDVYVRDKLLSDGSLFTQVFVGPFQTKADAVKVQQKIKTVFNEQGLVVRYREQ